MARLSARPSHYLVDRRPVCAIELSVWPRCDAEVSSERELFLPPLAPSAGATDRGRVGVPVAGPTQLDRRAGLPRSMCDGCIQVRAPMLSRSRQ